MDDKTLYMTMLLDFYGELLTDKQRSCFSMHYNEDLSLTEIADILGISRQGAYDLITRAENALSETEERLGLVARFSEQRRLADRMSLELKQLAGITQGEARDITDSLIRELEEFRN